MMRACSDGYLLRGVRVVEADVYEDGYLLKTICETTSTDHAAKSLTLIAILRGNWMFM